LRHTAFCFDEAVWDNRGVRASTAQQALPSLTSVVVVVVVMLLRLLVLLVEVVVVLLLLLLLVVVVVLLMEVVLLMVWMVLVLLLEMSPRSVCGTERRDVSTPKTCASVWSC
jgi:hypothetical protein